MHLSKYPIAVFSKGSLLLASINDFEGGLLDPWVLGISSRKCMTVFEIEVVSKTQLI